MAGPMGRHMSWSGSALPYSRSGPSRQQKQSECDEMTRRECCKGLNRRRLFGWGVGLIATSALVRGTRPAAAETEQIRQPANPAPEAFINRAFEMRDLAISSGDRGYGAIVVHMSSGQIVAQSPSRVITNSDPSAHAEMEAIRDAARRLETRDLSKYVMYSSSQPCAMCEAAAYWANLNALYFGRQGAGGRAPRLCS